MAKERVFKKLPEVHQTTVLDKFFKSTIDQWFSNEQLIKSTGYIGRKVPGSYNRKKDFYFPEIDLTRQNYQLEPVLVTKDADITTVNNVLFYDDILRRLSIEGSNILNHDRLFKSKAYSWAPPIDIDKFINYENYYWYESGPIKLNITATATSPLNITTDVVGQTSFTSENGITLSSGLKIVFSGANITPVTDINREYIVEGVGKSIQLIPVVSDDLDRTLPYILPDTESEHLWDSDFWDEVLWATTITTEGTPLQNRIDYITIERGGINQNPWSRTNSWYHKDILLQSTGKATGKTYTTETPHLWDEDDIVYDSTSWDVNVELLNETFSLDSVRQAKRPIIEFVKDIELYDYGLEGIGNTTVATTDNFNTIHSATSPIVDEHTLETGDTIIFLTGGLFTFYPWDLTEWDPSSHPLGTQNSPGPYSAVPAGHVGDWDVSLLSGADAGGVVYDVSIAAGTGVCTLTEKTTVLVDQKLFVKKGTVYRGQEFYWNGIGWDLCQLKSKQNTEPLFQLYDTDTIKLGDVGIYPGSTFIGSKIFSYKESTGTADIIIGKALEYKEFGQIADIVFTNNFEDSITWLGDDAITGYKYINQYDLSGAGDGPAEKIVSVYNNGWNPTNEFSKQRVVERHFPPNDYDQEHKLTVIPIVDNGIADVIVTVDGKLAKQSTATTAYDYSVEGNTLMFSLNKIIQADEVIEIKANTLTPVNLNSINYYEIPDNLEANPNNLDISDISASELMDHFSSIIEFQPGVIGNSIGVNNYRDTVQDRSKGRKILQHESSMLPLMHLLAQKEHFQITESIRYNQNEYEMFKSKFLQTVEAFASQYDTSITSVFVDKVLEDMYTRRSNLKVFTDVKGICFGTNYLEFLVYPDYDVQYIDLDERVEYPDIEEKQKVVYIYRTTPYERSNKQQHTLLTSGVDYTFKSVVDAVGNVVTRVQFTEVLKETTKIDIRIFTEIQNSFIPATASMIGAAPVYIPMLEVDDTYVDDIKTFIVGHDGSRTLSFHPTEEYSGAYVDKALLELEKRIYNAIPNVFMQDYLPDLNYFDITPGKFRSYDYTLDEYNQILEPIIRRWGVEHSVDFTTHRTYDASLAFTWNYSTQPDRDGNVVPGSWRGIYMYYYDTVRPHSHPWEMLGFSIIPGWWKDEYGTTYESTNTHLWGDLKEGIIRHGSRENVIDNSYLTNNPFCRTGLADVIPVDATGKLLNPVQAGIFGDRTTVIPIIVKRINITNPGSGYTSVPAVTINAPVSGTTATAIAVIDTDSGSPTYQQVTEIKVQNTGSGYTASPVPFVTIAPPPSGTTATAVAEIDGNYTLPHITDRHLDWKIGDLGPAEFSIRLSSNWLYIVNKLLFLLRPTEYCTKLWDTLKFGRSVADPAQVLFTDTNKRKQLKDLRFHSPDKIVYGFQPWVQAFFTSTGRDYTALIATTFATTDVALGYKAGGFLDDDVKAMVDSYSTTRTSDSIFIPNENKSIHLYNGYSDGVRTYSGITITITGAGFKVSGYDSFNSAFRIIPWISDGPLSVVEVGNIRVNRYNTYYDSVQEIPYDFQYTSHQDVFNFIVSYGRYLESLGFVFDQYDYDATHILDFEYAAKEFLGWVQQSTWEVGSFLTVSPSALSVKLSTTGIGKIENITEVINNTYTIIDKNKNLIPMTDVDIHRETDSFSVSSLSGVGIYGLKLNPFKAEHILIFDNVTDFNDLMYDPLLRLRQDRVKLNLTKTANWTGNVEAPGYIIKNDNIIPNFDTTANNFRKLFNVHDTPTTNSLLSSARHLVGYQDRDYLDNITEDAAISFEFYKGMLRQKGNFQSVDKLLRSDKLNNDALTFFEEFAFKVGEFGATNINTTNEIQLKSADVRVQNPLIEFTYESAPIDVITDDIIQINYSADTRWVSKPRLAVPNVWPTLPIGFKGKNWLPTAGYVHNDDIIYKVFHSASLARLNTIAEAAIEPSVGATAHMAKSYIDEFNVFKLVETDLQVRSTALLNTGKTRISVVDENIPTITSRNTATLIETLGGLPANVGDTINVELDGGAAAGGVTAEVTLSTFDFASENPILNISTTNVDLIKKDESIYINNKEVVFSSIPPGPFTIIGNIVNPKITETAIIKINGTKIRFVRGDKLTSGGADNVPGTAQAGATSTITLEKAASSIDDIYIDQPIEITNGPGVGQIRIIVSYDGFNKIAVVDNNWSTPPGSTSTYRIAISGYPGGMVSNITDNIFDVVAYDMNGYLRLTTTQSTLHIDTLYTLVDSDFGVYDDVYYNDLTISEIHSDIINAGIPDLFATKNLDEQEIVLTSDIIKRIEVAKGVGDAYNALYFTNSENVEVYFVDTRVVSLDNVIDDLNNSNIHEDFSASRTIDGNIALAYNGQSIAISGPGLSALGLQAESSVLKSSLVTGHDFKENDVIIIKNVKDDRDNALDIVGGYIVEEEVVYISKTVSIENSIVTIVDLINDTTEILTNVNKIPVYDIVSVDRDFIEEITIDLSVPVSPNHITIGDTANASSILPAFTAIDANYSATNIGPYTSLVGSGSNIIIATQSGSAFTNGVFTVTMTVRKRATFVIDEFEEKIGLASDNIELWHSRRFATKENAFENVQENKGYYAITDLVWVDNEPNGWLVGKLVDTKDHFGLSTITPSIGGTGYTEADIGKKVSFPITLSETKVQPVGKITGIKYGIGSVIIGTAGIGYTSPPLVTFTGVETDVPAVAEAVIESVITGITITNAGGGYQAIPSLQISESPIYTGLVWNVEHNLNQRLVNLEIMDYEHKSVNMIYHAPVIKYVDANNLTVTWTSPTAGYIDIIKSEYFSSLFVSENIWIIPHNLGDQYVNVDIIYSDYTGAQGYYDHPLIEYADANNLVLMFSAGVRASGYVAVTYGDGNDVVNNGYVHTTGPKALTWTVNHNLGKRHVNVDVAFLGTEINFTSLGNWSVVTHSLAQQHVNIELIDASDNVVNNIYQQVAVEYANNNSIKITGGSIKIEKVNVIRSRFVSALQSATNTWTITHNLNKSITNVDIIYDNGASPDTSARASHDHPLIEYTDANNIRVIFPTGITKSGYAVVAHNDTNSVSPAPGYGYEHTEASAVTTWTVAHNLGSKYVNVDIAVLGSSITASEYTATLDSAKYYNIKGLYDYPEITFVDANNLTITFPTAIAGKAVVSGGTVFETGSAVKYYNIKGNYDFPVIDYVNENQLTATFVEPAAGKLIVSAGEGIIDDDSTSTVHMEVGTTGGCVGMTKNNAGSGYSVNDVITLVGGTSPDSELATASVTGVDVGAVNSLTVTNPGSGYTSAPTVTIDAPASGTTATATCTVSAGAVNSITITLAGDGYTSAPNVVFSGGGGSSAVAVATVTVIGAVTSITQTAGGDYTTVLPALTGCETSVVPAGGTLATLDLLFKVKSIDILVSDAFQTTPDLKIAAPPPPGGGCTPVQATATATIAGVVDRINILANGVYPTVPTVVFSGGEGAGAAGTAVLAGPVTTLSIETIGDITYNPTSITNLSASYIDTIVGSGLSVDVTFTDITSFDTWFETHRFEEKRINSALFGIATLFNTDESVTEADMQLIDPVKGIISGLADTEITYRLERDPARYNVTDDISYLVDNDLIWDSKQQGHIWWDLSTVKFYDAEQGDNRYRRQYWGKTFPGSSIDIYEWHGGLEKPLLYTGQGTIRNVDQYSQISEWDIETNQYRVMYYYWIKNNTVVPNVPWRSRPASIVAEYIKDLNSQGMPWIAPVSNYYEQVINTVLTYTGSLQQISTDGVLPSDITKVRINGTEVTYSNGVIDSDGKITTIILSTTPIINDVLQVSYKKLGGAMIVNGIDHLITAEDSVLQLEYSIKETEKNVHKQWVLLRPDDERSFIPDYFINKMIDSLVGYDKSGLIIPDTVLLHPDEQLGTLYRPRQSWFKNVQNSRKDFTILVNTILKTLTVNDNKTGWDVDVYTNQFIEYIDWWETGYSTVTVIDYTVETIAKRKLLTGLLDGDIIQVTNDGTKRWRVYKYVLATNTFLKIGAEKQTFKFIDATYTKTFSVTDSTDFRAIIDAIFENVFTVEWLIKKNEVFFGMVHYVLSEQENVDWIFKSTYLNVSSTESEVGQIPKFKVDLQPSIEEYITEIKPYTSKIREFKGVKELTLESVGTHITDFDNPPYLNSAGNVVPLLTNTAVEYDLVLQTGVYKDYLENHTNTNLLRSAKISLVFDRVSTGISLAKTYLTSGAWGVDSRTVHHSLALTEQQRLRSIILDLYNRTDIGDFKLGNATDRAAHRLAKYSTELSSLLIDLATVTLPVDTDVIDHPIIIANSLHTNTTLTYDQLIGEDVYYNIASGYHEDLTLTIVEAIQRYDYDINAVYRTGQQVDFSSTTDAVNITPGTSSITQDRVNRFMDDYYNKQDTLLKELDNIFHNPDKLQLSDGSLFSLTSFQQDSPTPKEWGWDSNAWDHSMVEDGTEKQVLLWDDGGLNEIVYSEFSDYAIAEKNLLDDRIGWHIYNQVTKSGVERVDSTDSYIYITASGIPDHTTILHDPTWNRINEDNTNEILHQNAMWVIPKELHWPATGNKEVTPAGSAIAILRNGITLWNSNTGVSHNDEDIWHNNAGYKEANSDGYGAAPNAFFWRFRDEHGGSVGFAGEYHYYTNPTGIYNDSSYAHSPLLGYAFDGVPIYGPQSYTSTSYIGDGTTTVFVGPTGPEYSITNDAGTIIRLIDDAHIKIIVDGVSQVPGTHFTYTGAVTPVGNEKNQITFAVGKVPAADSVVIFTVTSKMQKMRSSYRLKTGTRVAIGTETILVGNYTGEFVEDYEYVAALGDLDVFNGRTAVTPEYPNGVYAYYVTVDDLDEPVYPYVIGPRYCARPEKSNYNATAPTVVESGFVINDMNQSGIPNISIDRQGNDSKGFVRPTVEQWPDELIPISSKEGLQITVETREPNALYVDADYVAADYIDPYGLSASFRIYYDADGETKYYALPEATTTKLSSAITKEDTEITVTDVTLLPVPNVDSYREGYTVPSVVFIGSERVEYFDIDIVNNKLLHCRRGTGTTSVQAHVINTKVFNGGVNNILTYQTETDWDIGATYGMWESTSPQATFFKDLPGSALLG